MFPGASALVVAGIAGLALFCAGLFIAGLRRVRPAWTPRASALVALWLVTTTLLAASGWLHRFDVRPPPMVLMFVVVIAGGIALGRSRVGAALAELPLWLLVLVQGFRLPLELVMHAAATEGTMPTVMSYSGKNFDIVTGASAIVVGLALRAGAPRLLAAAWVAVAFVTLATVGVVALLASPMFRAFGPDEVNTWVTYPVFVWLPTVLVLGALIGQIAVVRALGRGRASGAPLSPP